MTAPTRLLAKSPAERLAAGRPLTFAGVPDGAEGLVIADLARTIAAGKNPPAISLAVICRDGARMAVLSRALSFFAPDIEVLEFPAWDCLPYDRVSPHPAVVAQRMMTLARLARSTGREHPAVNRPVTGRYWNQQPGDDRSEHEEFHRSAVEDRAQRWTAVVEHHHFVDHRQFQVRRRVVDRYARAFRQQHDQQRPQHQEHRRAHRPPRLRQIRSPSTCMASSGDTTTISAPSK